MSRVQGENVFTYRLRVVPPPNVTISGPIRATVYIVRGLRANTSYTVYVSAGSLGVYGPEVSAVNTTIGSECYDDYDVVMYCIFDPV